MIKDFAKYLACKGIYWEVLDPDCLISKEAVDFSKKRINFYKRLGGLIFSDKKVSYDLPEINQELVYKIMFFSFEDISNVPDFAKQFEN